MSLPIRHHDRRPTCPDFLATTYDQLHFAHAVVFFVALLATGIVFCMFRTRTTAGRKLLGLPYLLALLLFIMSVLPLLLRLNAFAYRSTDSSSAYALNLLTTTLRQCEQVGLTSYYNLLMVQNIFYGIAYWCLLVASVWTLNSMLRERLDRSHGASKFLCATIVTLMGCFTAAYIGLQSYHLWLNTISGLYSNRVGFVEELLRVNLAFWCAYLASVLVSGAFALLAVRSLRLKHVHGNALHGWIAALITSLSLWCLINIMRVAAQINVETWEFSIQMALTWIQDACLVISLVLVIIVAKSMAWNQYAERQAGQYPDYLYGQHDYQHDRATFGHQ